MSKKAVSTPKAGDASDASEQQNKKVTRLGIEARKEINFSDWYSEVLRKGDFMAYYDVSGCYYILPNAYFIWKCIYEFFDAAIVSSGVEDMYAPMFVTRAALEKEKTHIEDFAPEVAWVTRAGSSDLAEPIAIRPTSETVLYPMYARRIRSHRDLPLRLNQWSNVVRWEFKTPQPFLRTREFLWQEGHSAFATRTEAEAEVFEILELYRRVYEELLAIPVLPGRKTEAEKFPGADFTTTVEIYVPISGRGIQGATSHYLGMNFAKMFDIKYSSDEESGKSEFVHQNSWGISTRTIGALTMVHGDDRGVILPPRVARLQSVIVPCGISAKSSEAERAALQAKCLDVLNRLRAYDAAGIDGASSSDGAIKTSALNQHCILPGLRVHCDTRDNYSPGWKFNHWEMMGVPLRIEIGPQDLAKNQVTAVRRDNGERLTLPDDENLANAVTNLLESIQKSLLDKATAVRDANLVLLEPDCDFSQFCRHLDARKIILAPFCGDKSCESCIKDRSAENAVVEEGAPSMGAKTLCVPLVQPSRQLTDLDKCIGPDCDRKPIAFTLFGRSY